MNQEQQIKQLKDQVSDLLKKHDDLTHDWYEQIQIIKSLKAQLEAKN